MATTTRPSRKGAQQAILVTEIEQVPLTKLKTFPGNPRRGDINAIADSLQTNKQYRPIVVQRSTGHILAGNHTYLAAQRLGWRTIAVSFIDVDDQEAKRINVADNRLPELGDYDGQALKDLLLSIDNPEIGIGFTSEDLAVMLEAQEDAAMDAAITMSESNDGPPIPDIPGAAPDDPVFGDSEEESEGDTFKDAEDDLPGSFTLKDEVTFPGAGVWEIPVLRSDMLIEEMPEPLLTWAGTATKEWPDDVWWLYNFGPDSTYGMKDTSRAILSFYAYDEFIDPWWYYPSRFVAKMLNSQIAYAITPNYSTEEMPRTLSLMNTFRSRWLGRYMQDAGVRVAPDIEWRVGDMNFMKIVVQGLPKRLPWASIQAQNQLSKRKTGETATDERLKQWGEDVAWYVETLDIQNLLVYTTEQGMRHVQSLGLPCGLRFCESRWDVKRRIQPPRKAKKGEAKL